MGLSRSQFLILLCYYYHINILMMVTNSRAENLFSINKFSATLSCKLSDRLAAGCAEIQSDKSRSIVDCARKCGNSCIAISFDLNKNCYIHLECPDSITLATCGGMDFKFTMYSKDVPCLHSGIFNESTSTCKCVGGWVGIRCERPPKSCQELAAFGYKTPPYIWANIKINSDATPFRVLCSLFDTFVTSRLMHNTGSLLANRTWDDFVHGFYQDNSNFWIGLEQMRLLNTNKLNILCSDVQFGNSSEYNLFSYRYNGFRFGNSSSGYRFTFTTSGMTGVGPKYKTYNASFTSCMEDLKNVQFSTWDKDSDKDGSQNCADVLRSGWWYANCSVKCTPLGSIGEWLSIAGLDLTAANYAESLMYFTTA